MSDSDARRKRLSDFLFEEGQAYSLRKQAAGGMYPHFWCEAEVVKNLNEFIEKSIEASSKCCDGCINCQID